MSDENPTDEPPGPEAAPRVDREERLDDGSAPPGSPTDRVEAFEQRAVLAEHRLAEVLGAYRQLRNENEGYRERITKNIERRYNQRRERLLLKFIDLLDNFDRALEAAEQSYTGVPLIDGLILVRSQLLQTLQEEGLERIPVIGLPYDPNFSEAVQTQPVEDPDQHQIVMKELLRGYRLNGRIARPSKVVVGEYPNPQPVVIGATPVVGTPPEAIGGAADVAPGFVPDGADDQEEETALEDIVTKIQAQEALFAPGLEPEKPEDDEPDR